MCQYKVSATDAKEVDQDLIAWRKGATTMPANREAALKSIDGERTIRIVEATRADFPVWKRLRQSLYTSLDPEFHDEEMAWIHDSDEAACFLAWTGTQEAVALLEVSLRNVVDGCVGGPVGYVEGVYLEPSERGQGFGTRLIEFAKGWFLTRGCREMATDAEIDNVDAQEFYRRIGFTEMWRVVGFTKSL